MKTGKLVSIGQALLSRVMYYWDQCVDCKDVYPRDRGGVATCNGRTIPLCPWCRPDSRPWTNGRGA